MSGPTALPTSAPMVSLSLLDHILTIIAAGGVIAHRLVSANATANGVNELGTMLVRIVRSASAAHQAITGQPINLDLLQPIEPLPLESPK